MFGYGWIAFFLAIGFVFGSIAEKKHLKELKKKENFLRDIILSTSKNHSFIEQSLHATLVTGHVVVALDYFKRFVATLVNLVGGRVYSFESLIDRGRREAIIRMKEDAHRNGFDSIVNVRIETSNIGGTAGKKGGMGAIEVMAYGTAIKHS